MLNVINCRGLSLLCAWWFGLAGLYGQPKHASLDGVPNFLYELVATKPADTQAYTQGLQYVDGILYLGTGLYGKSEVKALDWDTGEVRQLRALPKIAFGEGITVWDGNIYQLTWKLGLLYIYAQHDFSLVDIRVYEGQGWGLTHNGNQFIMSNGSATLYFRDSETFTLKRELKVTWQGQPVNHINELEWVEGWLIANRWGATDILIIHPDNGHVVAQLQLASIVQEVQQRSADAGVLNGVAYDAACGCLLVTGKNWDRIYVLKVDLAVLAQ